MAITLITGTPGAGKTAAAVSLLLQMPDRPIFSDGVSGLLVDHQECPPIKEWTTYIPDESSEDGKKLVFTFPENAVILIDEAQRKFRPAGSAAKVPDVIAAFETHRHEGIDFILITQGPHLIHSNIRALVKRHIHIRDLGVMGRWWYEFTECSCPPSFRNAPIKKTYKLDKKVFKLYKSSKLHTQQKMPMPNAMKVLLLCIPLAVYLGYKLYGSYQSKVQPSQSQALQQSKPDEIKKTTNPLQEKIAEMQKTLDQYTPRIAGRPETAPIYDGLRQAKAMPLLHGCAKSSKSTCTCFDQNATPIHDVPKAQCEAYLNHLPYDPYRDPQQAHIQNATYTPSPSPASADNPQWRSTTTPVDQPEFPNRAKSVLTKGTS